MTRFPRFIPSIVALALGACAVGPNFRPPATPAASAGKYGAADSIAVSSEPLPEKWWQLYDDPALDALVTEALTANTDIRVATASLRRARAILSETRGQLLPSTNISGGAAYVRSNGTSGGGSGGTSSIGTGTGGAGTGTGTGAGGTGIGTGTGTGTGGTGAGTGGTGTGNGTTGTTGATVTSSSYQGQFYQAGLDVSYELDLYGRVRRDIEASRADLAAQEAQRDTVRTSVAAETARAYADACSAALQIGVARQSLSLQLETYDLTERLAQAGRGTPLDTSRARAQYEQVRATLPSFVASRRDALYRLSVLTGHPPEETPSAAAACTTPPVLKRPIPVGDGTALIKRRPDIRQADRNLAAATARIGVATAALYPKISLGGSIGTSGISLSQLGGKEGLTFNVGPLLSWTFPNITVARARIRQAEASSEAALASFDGTVLTALQETETAMTDLAGELDRQAALTAARDYSAEAARIVGLRYGAGAENFLAVLDAQRTLATAEANLAASRAQLTTDQVAVFKALGGGWENAPETNTSLKVTYP
nr:efflux transporter outer membrane subunit [Polymorphobacter sp.]